MTDWKLKHFCSVHVHTKCLIIQHCIDDENLIIPINLPFIKNNHLILMIWILIF